MYIKKTVFDIEDLRALSPLFKNRFFTWLGNKLLRWISMDKVNQIHAKYCHLHGSTFTSAMLSDPMMNVKYHIHHRERLDSLPSGSFITVSNHPIGSLDGIILIDIFASLRPDFAVMVNGMLTKIGAMADNFISVTPKTNAESATNPSNINGIRVAIGRLKKGHPIGFFPAGAMSFINKQKQIRDLPWTHSVIRLIRKAKVPVYPVCFGCRNSSFFYWLGRISWKIRTLRVPVEAFNKQGQTFDVYIREPIPPEIIKQYTDDNELADFLYNRTYEGL
ncbi:MAG: lysophospholipid acyltransferase family protein [Tannerella sp.]|jgi:putative hemolysin|nr:lysophospholipid acyltransferase family protein [Tannerella sp.]